MTDPNQDVPTTDARGLDIERCPVCGRELWSDGLPPARDGNAWICGDCDAARNFEVLDLD